LDKKNRVLVQKVLRIATGDFKNLTGTSEELTPLFKVGLFEVLGPKTAIKFLDTYPEYRALIFHLEEEIVREERGLKND
jgi:hypothetical protein